MVTALKVGKEAGRSGTSRGEKDQLDVSEDDARVALERKKCCDSKQVTMTVYALALSPFSLLSHNYNGISDGRRFARYWVLCY